MQLMTLILQRKQTMESCKTRALRLLEYRDRTEKELTMRLLKDGYKEEEVRDVTAWAASSGFLNDVRFAENYIYLRSQTTSRQKIIQELREKGIDRETIEEAFASYKELYTEDETGLIRSFVLKKVQEGETLGEKQMRSLLGALCRRGFSYSDIRKVLDDLSITCSREM